MRRSPLLATVVQGGYISVVSSVVSSVVASYRGEGVYKAVSPGGPQKGVGDIAHGLVTG